jgi:RNA polymerase sigma-70 factor (ECF subfamily)
VNFDLIRREEFERVAMPHAGSLLRLAMRLEHDRGRSEDLVQETLLRAWRAFDQFERGTNCKAWLFRILLNLFSKRRRKVNTAPQMVSLEASESATVIKMPVVKSHLTSMEVVSAFDTLSEDHRVVLVLAVIEGFTCKEIAQMCGLPMGTVMSRLSRARVALREALGYSHRKERYLASGR